jgi:hypothetical protein
MQAGRPAAIQWTDEEASHAPSVVRSEIRNRHLPTVQQQHDYHTTSYHYQSDPFI